MAYTSHYNLKKIGAGETIADEGYKYSSADRDTIDQVLYNGATHHHIGSTVTITGPTAAPVLALVNTPGNLLPGVRYYYRYTFIDSQGNESLPSSEGFIDTNAAVVSPAAPSLSTSPTGGSLIGGTYFYVLTAYDPDSSRETLATNGAQVTAAVGSANTITITFPTLPSGAHGFNIYRSAPGGLGYLFLTSVAMNVATPPTSYVDTGAVLANCDRTLPTLNTTNMDQAVQVGVGGATPTIPAGDIWRIYRTAVSGNYSNSLLTTITIPSLTYLDSGLDTSVGSPPAQGGSTTNPTKVLLTDGTEVQGRLPMGRSTFPCVEVFEFPGSVSPGSGTGVWVCDAPAATIIGCRVYTARGSTAPGDVTLDLLKYMGATPTFTTVFTTAGNRPKLLSGQFIGSMSVQPDVPNLVQGDALSADIVSISAATPVANYLYLAVYMVLHDYPSVSYVDGTTTGA